MGHGFEDGPNGGLGSNQLDKWLMFLGILGGLIYLGNLGPLLKMVHMVFCLMSHKLTPNKPNKKKDLGVIIVVKMTLQMTHPETCIENRWTRNQDKISQDESIRPLLSNMKSLTHL